MHRRSLLLPMRLNRGLHATNASLGLRVTDENAAGKCRAFNAMSAQQFGFFYHRPRFGGKFFDA